MRARKLLTCLTVYCLSPIDLVTILCQPLGAYATYYTLHTTTFPVFRTYFYGAVWFFQPFCASGLLCLRISVLPHMLPPTSFCYNHFCACHYYWMHTQLFSNFVTQKIFNHSPRRRPLLTRHGQRKELINCRMCVRPGNDIHSTNILCLTSSASVCMQYARLTHNTNRLHNNIILSHYLSLCCSLPCFASIVEFGLASAGFTSGFSVVASKTHWIMHALNHIPTNEFAECARHSSGNDGEEHFSPLVWLVRAVRTAEGRKSNDQHR